MPVSQLLFGLLLIAAIIGVVFYMRSPTRSKHKLKRPLCPKGTSHVYEILPDEQAVTDIDTDSQTRHPYHNVTIELTQTACQAVKELQGNHFLSQDAPSLPLTHCDALACQCHYKHSEDRRDEPQERRIDYGVTHDLYGAFGEKNRRASKFDRRVDDK
ncbi:hypothetical protein FM038_020450 [Shewanella eurypsychrophilus]|uniref:Uncharacterized protein n=1 Tax=Shewanella eurypsychrophilus TaxID=2593656 RepID=A0ABX6VC56_9GAMM|nr:MULTISPECIES: hypothetical protein [Shewanella]QFU24286.1 hypothetical protein FS418_22165 [Shewanella sp. YLB-09]QPG59487.1 hypothetical protein FM038_020450 [Shewanella eurypsychrophilus]